MLEPDDPYRVECLLSLATQRQELGEIDHAQEALRAAMDAADPRQAVLANVLMCRQSTLTADSRAADIEKVLRLTRWWPPPATTPASGPRPSR
jgi:Tfp pilus assembly protein PilF